jgi:SAM-dependent methyltransferase
MISIYTPSHKADTLIRAYESLVRQTHTDWEWVLLVNGKLKVEDVPEEIRSNPKVRVILSEVQYSVGALKAAACGLAKGDLFVELDHDDELRSDCLSKLQAAAEATPNGFYFSDFCEQLPEGGSKIYDLSYGWKTQKAKWDDGSNITAMVAKEATARSLFQIFYAPNHVRAWSRSAYEKSGGYSNLPVCDDHDLLIRTYLAGVPMVRIPECLYLQHVSPTQTQVVRNKEIQKRQEAIGSANLEALCLEWARRNDKYCLDMGGVHNAPSGYLTIDQHPGANFQLDVTEGLPFEDNSVGVIRAYDFLEHIPIGKVVAFMNECWRVLAPGGWMLTATPSTDGRGAFQDPTHVSFWNANSFWYYTQQQRKYVPEVVAEFQLTRLHNYFPSDWHMKNNIPYVAADLWAIKGQDMCGVDLNK